MVIVTNKNVKKFISNLQKDTQSKVLRYIELLEKFGPNLRMPYAKRITKDLYELRIRGKQETRIFYTIRSNKAFLLHGYVKKTNKTPLREIKKALARLISIDI